MSRLPDFVVIGAMKCATSSLHDQLARQPGLFMSTPKEPCFFSDDTQYDRGLSWYTSLFDEAAASDRCGESSTHYTKLPTFPATVARMQRALDRPRLVYVIRHPIERLVSQYVHEWTQRVVTEPIDTAVDRHPELVAYSQYSRQIEPYLEAFGREAILLVFAERLKAAPQRELERIARHIGHLGAVRWDDARDPSNVSAARLRKSPLRDALLDVEPLRTIRRRWVPQSLRNRVKRLWTMNARPTLAASVTRRLEDVFDADLAHLSRQLTLPELSCRTFSGVALGAPTMGLAS